MAKRIMALLLALIMVIGLVACGNANTTPEETDPVQADAPQADVSEKEPEVKADPVTVKWMVRGTQQEDHDQVMAAVNELLLERYNLQLELEIVDASELTQRMELMMTSGEDYDLCYASSWCNPFFSGVNKEAFLPLDDLLANSEAGQALMEVYPEKLLDYGRVGGNVYGLANYQKMYTQYCALVRKDLADKYGLDVNAEYKTLAELEPFMDQILENEKDIWPLCAGNPTSYYAIMGCAWDGINGPFMIDLDSSDMEVMTKIEIPSTIENYKKLNEYFKKGYIREDQATATDQTSDMMAGRYAITMVSSKPGANVDWAATYGGEYYQIDLGEPFMAGGAGLATMTCINVNSKNPEAALKMYEVMWTDTEIFNMMLFGLEGEHYTKDGEDRIVQIADSGYNMGGTFGWQLGNQFNAYKMEGQADDIWEVTDAINNAAAVSPLAGFAVDISAVETELAQIAAVVEEYEYKYVYAEDLDAYLEAYLNDMNDAGAETVKAEFQRQLDEFLAANG